MLFCFYRCLNFVFNNSQKMALRAPYVVTGPQALGTFMKRKQNALNAIFYSMQGKVIKIYYTINQFE